MQKHFNQPYDKDAKIASSGEINLDLLSELLNEDYLHQPAPKSTGRELFNLPWLEKKLHGTNLSSIDVLTTLTEFTAVAIANDIRKLTRINTINELLACGGGANNPLLMERLQHHLHDWQIGNTMKYGINADFMEAMAFAWLAHQTINHLPGNLPAATGASRLAVLGAIYLAN